MKAILCVRLKKNAPKGMNEWERTKWESKMRKAFHREYSNKKQEWKKNEPIPQTETEKSAMEELNETNSRVNKVVSKFKEMFEGSDKQQAIEHLYALGVDVKEDSAWENIEKFVKNAVAENLQRAEAKERID